MILFKTILSWFEPEETRVAIKKEGLAGYFTEVVRYDPWGLPYVKPEEHQNFTLLPNGTARQQGFTNAEHIWKRISGPEVEFNETTS